MAAEDAREQRLLDGIALYAAADASDPFCLARCLAHHRQGMDAPLAKGEDGGYQATRTAHGFTERARP